MKRANEKDAEVFDGQIGNANCAHLHTHPISLHPCSQSYAHDGAKLCLLAVAAEGFQCGAPTIMHARGACIFLVLSCAFFIGNQAFSACLRQGRWFWWSFKSIQDHKRSLSKGNSYLKKAFKTILETALF